MVAVQYVARLATGRTTTRRRRRWLAVTATLCLCCIIFSVVTNIIRSNIDSGIVPAKQPQQLDDHLFLLGGNHVYVVATTGTTRLRDHVLPLQRTISSMWMMKQQSWMETTLKYFIILSRSSYVLRREPDRTCKPQWLSHALGHRPRMLMIERN